MSQVYDVAIAGAGPAGTVLAYFLAKRGFKVAVFEMRSRSDIWGKPCGDAVGAHHFERNSVPLPSHVIRSRVKAIDVYSPSCRVVYRVRGEGYIIDRRSLGAYLLGEAERHGAELYFSTYVRGVVIESGVVKGLVVEHADRKRVVRARVVVDATGFPRAVKMKLPSSWPVAEGIEAGDYNSTYRVVVEYEEEIFEHPEVLRIYLGSEVAPGGYAWVFPESRSSANIGLGVQAGVGNPSPLKLFHKKLAPKWLKPYKHRVVSAGGAPIPTRHPAASLVGPGVMVIGDAAYAVNPLHGGGIGYAFETARLAAQAFEEAYNRGDFSEKSLWSLNVAYMRSTGAKQAALDIFRRFLQKLSDEEIEYGMEKRLIPEVDVYDASTTGELKLSTIEKALIVLRGLRRPSLLRKLKLVAEYMKMAKTLYQQYPETPEKLHVWINQRNSLIRNFMSKLEG